MSSRFHRGASLAVLAVALCLGAVAQAQTAASPDSARRAAASAPPAKQKRASTAKTPPGKAPRGSAHCNDGDKAQRQRCLRDLYGPGAPPV